MYTLYSAVCFACASQ